MASRASPTTELYFENCRIPGDRIIGEPGTCLHTALEAAIAYTKDRKQFGVAPDGALSTSIRKEAATTPARRHWDLRWRRA